MIGELCLLAMLIGIPFFAWQQREEGRNYVMIFITGLLSIYYLATNSIPVVWDLTTGMTVAFILWMVASIFWTNSRQSSFDLYSMTCGLIVMLVARMLPVEHILIAVMLPGAVFAVMCLYNHNLPISKPEIIKKVYFIFGNKDHIGAFYLAPFFSAIWLTLNMSLWFAPFVGLFTVAIARVNCRGAQLGALAGLFFVAVMQTPWVLLSLPVILIAAWLALKPGSHKFIELHAHRISIWLGAFLLIKRKLWAGYGLRSFRREYPTIMPELLSHRFTKQFFGKGMSLEQTTSHRIHNDHLETVMELGIIGYFLLCAIFYSLPWQAATLLAGVIVAWAVDGFFFFPLREAHTALPFWALIGTIAHTAPVTVSISPLIAIISILVIGRILYGVFLRLVGLYYYDCSIKNTVAPNVIDPDGLKVLDKKQKFLRDAVKFDPYNNIYLTEGYYFHVFNQPEIAFQYASRCLENYDGGKVKWGVSDQYARALLRLGGFGVAKLAVRHALHLCPDFQQAIELGQQINLLESQSQPKEA